MAITFRVDENYRCLQASQQLRLKSYCVETMATTISRMYQGFVQLAPLRLEGLSTLRLNQRAWDVCAAVYVAGMEYECCILCKDETNWQI